MTPPVPAHGPRLLVAAGARRAEEQLLEIVESTLPCGLPSGGAIVVVPSRSLREHLLAALARRRPAWLGLEVATLRAVARGILAAAGEAPPAGAALFDLALARAARRRPALARAFSGFDDGWATLSAAARDLVDAGFEPAHLGALADRVEAERGLLPGRTLERARLLLAALVEALEELRGRGLAPDAALLSRAVALLGERSDEWVGGRQVIVHGFSDATGLAADLLVDLLRSAAGTAILVRPSSGEVGAAANAFGARLLERFEGIAGRAERLAEEPRSPKWLAFTAASPELEARAVVAAAALAIDRGVRAESIAIVLRDLPRERAALRRELERQGIPFSGSAATGPVAAEAHRVRSLLRLLEDGPRAPLDVALELVVGAADVGSQHGAAIRLALRALGASRLADLSRLRRGTIEAHRQQGFPLPARAGLETDAEGGDAAPRRRVPVAPLLAAIGRLATLRQRLERWPAKAPWASHRHQLEALLDAASAGDAELAGLLRGVAARLDTDLPDDFPLTRSEWLDLLRAATAPLERRPWGGSGSGVQLLSVVEARGRTFDLLCLPALARGVFPRPVAEEPVLPDDLRSSLRDVLPDLPVKREGHDEERLLFAQLLGNAAEVVLSRPSHDAEGKPLPASPLLEALLRGGSVEPIDPPEPPRLAALDRAILAAVDGGEPALAPRLGAALEEGRRRTAGVSMADLRAAARARLRVLQEFETDPTSPAGRERIRTLGPYFGLLGAGALQGSIAATTLEAMARCAWQALLERTLRIEPTPDPLGALPGLDPLLVGTVVHDVLGRLFADEGAEAPRSLDERSDGPGRPLVWPAADQVERAVTAAAAAALERAGLAGLGLEPLLALRVRARLAVARAADERRPGARLLGTEIAGAIETTGPDGLGPPVHFRADRLARESDRLVFTDFKSGRVPQDLRAKQAATRTGRLLVSVAQGRRLQGALYVAAAGARPAEARYLFLDPDDDPPERELPLAGDAPARAALDASLATLLEARRLGLFPPRLADARLEKEFAGCASCVVAEACVQRDSGFRLRLERWHEHERPRDGSRSAIEEALWRLWQLPEQGKLR